jgi:hypothetical protein
MKVNVESEPVRKWESGNCHALFRPLSHFPTIPLSKGDYA